MTLCVICLVQALRLRKELPMGLSYCAIDHKKVEREIHAIVVGVGRIHGASPRTAFSSCLIACIRLVQKR